ncbi:MAG: protein hupE [Tagaea sp. CACIAM 22H2]|nr:protein hupE [Tagaea sp. CACIAM 22H2]
MNRSIARIAAAALATLAAATPALAHPGHATDGMVAGFAHPLFGLDHILAMLAVGIFAAQKGGVWRFAVPASFMIAMALGGVLAISGVEFPMVETGIAFSVALFGLAIVFADRVPAVAGGVLAGVFALFHGAAHGGEIAEGASFLPYAIGFLTATGLLHAAGFAAATFASPTLRYAGAAIAAVGAILLFA